MTLLQQVLGEDWHKLPPVIQQHYQLEDGQQNSLTGSMTIAYPTYCFPLIWLIHLFGGLALWRGDNVQTRVQKTTTANTLHWQRIMTYSADICDYFRSQMYYFTDHEVIEMIGFGFGLRLKMTVHNGDLLYQSQGHFWQYGKLRVTLPDWLLLGTATISEHAVSADMFELNFTIKHPWWGETYSYRGCFHLL